MVLLIRVILCILGLSLTGTHAFAATTTAVPTPPYSPLLKRLERIIESARQDWDIPGIAVAVVEGNQIVFVKGFGVRQVGSQKPVDIHTVFQVASMSKTFTSALVGRLVDQGYLNFDVPISRYLPDFHFKLASPSQRITLRHILSHTSGIPAYYGDYDLERGSSYEALKNSIREAPVRYPAGRVYGYQNIVYSLTGDIIHRVTGQTFEQSLKRHIFGPLGMRDSSVGFTAFQNQENRAFPHVFRNNRHYRTPYSTAYYKVSPAAGVNASIHDIALWLRFHINNSPTLLQHKTLNALHSPHVDTPSENRRIRFVRDRISKTRYGLGWRIYQYAGQTMVYHGGYLRGFKSSIAFLPGKRIGIAILINGTAPACDIIRNSFFDLVLGLPEKNWSHYLKTVRKYSHKHQPYHGKFTKKKTKKPQHAKQSHHTKKKHKKSKAHKTRIPLKPAPVKNSQKP